MLLLVVFISAYNPVQKSLGQYCNIHVFLSFLGPLLKHCCVLFTLRGGLFDAYYFKCNEFVVEIYLSLVSLVNL